MANTIADKIGAITGATADTEFIDMGKKFVINSVPARMLIDYAVDGANITDGSGQALPDLLISVRRNNRYCREISEALAYAFDLDTTFTLQITDYVNLNANAPETLYVDGIAVSVVTVATIEVAGFIAETSDDATAKNLKDVLDTLLPSTYTVTVSTDTVTIVGAKSIDITNITTGITKVETSSTTSLYNATELFPRFYKRTGKLYIKPNPTASAIGVVNKVDYSDISDETLYDNIIVNYACAMEFTKMAQATRTLMSTELTHIINETSGVAADIDAIWTALSTWSGSSAPSAPTFDVTALANVTDALSNADKFIMEAQTIESVTAHSAGYWIYDEDAEMVQSATATAAQEVSRAKGELEKLMIQLGKYQAEIQAFSGETNEESSRWQAHISKAMAEIQEIQGRVSVVNGYGVIMNQDLQKAQQYYKFAFEEVNRIAMGGLPPQPQQDNGNK